MTVKRKESTENRRKEGMNDCAETHHSLTEIQKSTSTAPNNTVDTDDTDNPEEFDPFLDQLRTCKKSSYPQVIAVLDSLDRLLQTHIYDPQAADSLSASYLRSRTRFYDLVSKPASDFLLSILNKPPRIDVSEDDEDRVADLMDRASGLIAHLCGRGAAGAITRNWELPVHGVCLAVREPGLTEGDIGFKTWGAARALARLLDSSEIPVKDREVLELGSGTGLAGLAAAACGANKVYLTDYSPACLNSCRENAAANEMQFPKGPNTVEVLGLDWTKVFLDEEEEAVDAAGQREQYDEDLSLEKTSITESTILASRRRYDMIIGADLLYDAAHPALVARVVGKLLTRERRPHPAAFFIGVPLRENYDREVAEINDAMEEQGFVLEKRKFVEGREDDTNMTYRIDEWRRREEVVEVR